MKNSQHTFTFNYYTLYKLLRNNIQKLNRHLLKISRDILKLYEDDVDMSYIIANAVDLIEKNKKKYKIFLLTNFK